MMKDDPGTGGGPDRDPIEEPLPVPPPVEEPAPPSSPFEDIGQLPQPPGGGGPRQKSLAEQLVAATGAGSAGFQRLGTMGAAPFRSMAFERGRQTQPDEQVLRLGMGTPTAPAATGEGDDEARILRAARRFRF